MILKEIYFTNLKWYSVHMQNGRNTAGKFTSGNTGRPKGARNKKTLAIESLLRDQAEALIQKAILKALEGDGLALRLYMEHIAPAPRDKSVLFPYLKWKMQWMPLKPLVAFSKPSVRENLLRLKENACHGACL